MSFLSCYLRFSPSTALPSPYCPSSFIFPYPHHIYLFLPLHWSSFPPLLFIFHLLFLSLSYLYPPIPLIYPPAFYSSSPFSPHGHLFPSSSSFHPCPLISQSLLPLIIYSLPLWSTSFLFCSFICTAHFSPSSPCFSPPQLFPLPHSTPQTSSPAFLPSLPFSPLLLLLSTLPFFLSCALLPFIPSVLPSPLLPYSFLLPFLSAPHPFSFPFS